MPASLRLPEIIRARRAVLILERQTHAIDIMAPASIAYVRAQGTDTAYGVAINELDRLLATAAALETEQANSGNQREPMQPIDQTERGTT